MLVIRLYSSTQRREIEVMKEYDDMDPWSYTGSNHHQAKHDDMQSLGAGYSLGNARK